MKISKGLPDCKVKANPEKPTALCFIGYFLDYEWIWMMNPEKLWEYNHHAIILKSWNTIVRGARKSRKLNVPSIENLANCERVLLVKSYLNAKNQMKSSIIIWNCLNINIKQEITQKA